MGFRRSDSCCTTIRTPTSLRNTAGSSRIPIRFALNRPYPLQHFDDRLMSLHGNSLMPIPRILACHIAIFAALAATAAGAVNISQTGTGQVLIFPHYTVRNGFSTLISIDNTQNNTKAVKVRFREGLNGRNVFDFNLFLSPNDTWAGAVVETAVGARLITNDNSCVTPADLFTETRTDGAGLVLNAFKAYDYTGLDADAASLSSLDRTREGFFEVFEMGVIDPRLSASATLIASYVKQNAAGLPVNCSALDRYDNFAGNFTTIKFPNTGEAMMSPPTGGLRGRASLIGAASGANYSFSPTALDAWSSRVAYSASGNRIGVQLSDAFPTTSTVVTPTGTVMATWENGADAVSAVLMRDALSNEFVLDSGTNSQTDWIVTFPTKSFYEGASSTSPAKAPFSSGFSSNGSGACEPYGDTFANREAFTTVVTPPMGVPPPDYLSSSRLCWTGNVVPFSAGLLSSQTRSPLRSDLANAVRTSTTSPGSATTPILRGVTQGPNGRVTMRFSQALTPVSAVLVSPSGTTSSIPGKHFGLPVIGVMLHNYQNVSVASKYGGVVEHSYSVRIE